jgi:hypothetical protein
MRLKVEAVVVSPIAGCTQLLSSGPRALVPGTAQFAAAQSITVATISQPYLAA